MVAVVCVGGGGGGGGGGGEGGQCIIAGNFRGPCKIHFRGN